MVHHIILPQIGYTTSNWSEPGNGFEHVRAYSIACSIVVVFCCLYFLFDFVVVIVLVVVCVVVLSLCVVFVLCLCLC